MRNESENEHGDGMEGMDDIPMAVVDQRSGWSSYLIWVIPLVALVVGGWLVVKWTIDRGPTITIRFVSGEGLEAGKTKIKYKNVDIGVVKSVALADDHLSVVARAEMSSNVAGMLVDDSRFWVVRPRLSGGTVSGIGTLLSGSYIGMDVGQAKKPRSHFVGLETPPPVASGTPGHDFVLKSANMGSLDVGSPVFFRRLQVGQIVSYALDDDGSGMTIHVFVNAPYDQYVTSDTRFWQASGVDVSLDASGVKLNTESLVSILVGGLAFENPPGTSMLASSARSKPVPRYTLFGDRAEAMKPHDAIVDKYVLNFKESVRGLAVGAAVDFRGIVIGEVSSIKTHFDHDKKEFSIPVEVNIYPQRLISPDDPASGSGHIDSERRAMADYLVSRGLRAQLRTASLLTGQLYVAIDFFPAAPKATMNWHTATPQIPTVPGNLQSLQDAVTSLVSKLNNIPFEGISADLRKTLADTSKMMNTINTDVAPEAKGTLAAAREALTSANRMLQSDSPLQQNTADTMQELSRAAASVRSLADYLSRHPEALIRGKLKDQE